MLKILVVDKETAPAMTIVGNLGEGEAEVKFTSHVDRASNNIKNNAYDIIILGDKLDGGGDSYDVALELKTSNKNKHAAILCIGSNISKATKLANHLRPYAQIVDVSNTEVVEACVKQIRNHLNNRKEIKSGAAKK